MAFIVCSCLCCYLLRDLFNMVQSTLDQSEPGINVNLDILHTPQITRTGALRSDAV